MLAPRNRLLFWFAVVVLPFSLLGAVEPAAFLLSVVAIGIFLILLVADGLSTRVTLSGITVELPLVVRMSKDREGQLEVRIRNRTLKHRIVRLALGLPPEICSPHDEAEIALPADAEWSRFSWRCRPWKRGHYHITTVHVEASSPLQFWGTRQRFAVQSEIRVYPNLLADRRDLAAL